MDTPDHHDGATQQLRREIDREREELVQAVDTLRGSATSGRLALALEHRRSLVIAGALLTAFVLSGGIGAVMRMAFRRRPPELRERLRIGRFALVER